MGKLAAGTETRKGIVYLCRECFTAVSKPACETDHRDEAFNFFDLLMKKK